MRTVYVVQGGVSCEFTEILAAYSTKADAETYLRTCEEYDNLRPKGHTWAKHHPAGENGKYFDYYEIKEVELK